EDLAALASLIQVPVATTPQGKGLLADSTAIYLGPTGRDGVYAANRAARASDVILAIGTRFGDRSTSSWREGVTHNTSSTRLIHADIDANQIGLNYPAALGIVAEAKALVRQLLRLAKARKTLDATRRRGWLE